MKNVLIAIGPLPPPNYGQSLGFSSLCEKLKLISKIYILNIQPNFSKPGLGWKFVRLIDYFFIFLRFFFLLLRTKQNCKIYITVGQSNASFSRDFIFIILSVFFKRKIYTHLKGGNFKNFYDNSNWLIQNLIKYVYRKVFKIIILGNSLKNNFNFCKIIEKKIVVVENGLTTNFIKKEIKNKNKKQIQLIYLSNLIISKGYLDILEALKILEKNNVNYNCVFAGEFYISPDDPKKVNEHDLKVNFKETINKMKNVSYLGPVYNDLKIKLLEDADVFILPTYYINEGQPISIIEAMAHGNAIISTPYRSIVDLVKHGSEGYLIKPKRPDLIAENIMNLYFDKKLLLKMQNNALTVFKKKFTREKHISNMLKFLDIDF